LAPVKAAAPKVYLFFLSGAKKGKIEASEAQVVRIGRQPYCEIPLDPYQDIPASGEHAKIVCQPDGTFTLFDSGSSWGTFKNDVRLTGPVAITTGDVITFGLDQQGNVGPKAKFYLESDILRCPSCKGPVYKRHFKCPGCRKKVCLRCIDFKAKTCAPCGKRKSKSPAAKKRKQNAASGTNSQGYELVDDDEPAAKAPARVVISGKDAKRVKRAQARKKRGKKVKKNPRKNTRVMPGRGRQDPGVMAEPLDPGVLAERVDLESPFCTVCCDFVTAKIFQCPSCQQGCCVAHRKGKVCPACAGVTSSAALEGSSFEAGRGTEPELVIPNLDFLQSAPDDEVDPPPPSFRGRPSAGGVRDFPLEHSGSGSGEGWGSGVRGRPPGLGTSGSGVRRGGDVAPGSGVRGGAGSGVHARPGSARGWDEQPAARGWNEAAPPSSAPPSSAPPAKTPSVPTQGAGSLLEGSKIRARAPSAIPCEASGCLQALDLKTFFTCEGCRSRLCPSHRAQPGGTLCAPCAQRAAAPPRRPASPPLPRPAPLPGALPPPPKPIPSTMRFSGPGLPQHPPPPTLPQRRDQDMLETAEDELVLPPLPPLGPQDLIQTATDLPAGDALFQDEELSAVRFECPYCETSLPPHARACIRCGREL
jgi:hypothetical protein